MPVLHGELTNLLDRMTEGEVLQVEEELFEKYFFDGESRDEWQTVTAYLEDRLRYEGLMQ